MHGHYEHLAAAYDTHWSYRPGYVGWMAGRIAEALSLSSEDRMADIGCGTGLFTREVARMVAPRRRILCVDPSEAMLGQLDETDPGLLPVHASAEDIADGHIQLPYGQLDAVWFKESVHHLPDSRRTLAGVARLLAPRGRILIAMLPATIEYPLFPAALKRYEELQPDPIAIADSLRDAGMRVAVKHVEHELRLDRDRYLGMVRSRYMSVLSTFTESELDRGIEEMRSAHPEDVLVFPDRFAFVLGSRSDIQ
ncbi:class I SAM-dependent methyltransferase [Streptomyces cucumeris]|uniref:class I SAM-dependent methyltransferase n=1 Tax=Streptomyces cucumeris TaxID=2962890 RepID=UPI003D754602